jgi:hypothetical protein
MQPWIEGTVDQLYKEAGVECGVAVSPMRLVHGLLGYGTVRRVHASALPGDAALVRVHQERRIYVRACLARHRRDFAVLHELAEWHLEREDYQGSDREDVADALAAALLTPRRSFAAALRHHGPSFPKLAQHFKSTESLVALRYGEVTLEPLALVAKRVRVRGQGWVWPSEYELQRVARGQKSSGIRSIRLHDDTRRVALLCQ